MKFLTGAGLFLLVAIASGFGEATLIDTIKPRYDFVMKQPPDEIRRYIAELDGLSLSGSDVAMRKVVEGSLFSKLADLEFFFWDKLAHVTKGVELMRTGMSELDGQPLSDFDLLTLHLIHGITSGYIPTSFQPRAVSIHELETAIAMKGFDAVDRAVIAEVYALLAKGYGEVGNAQKSEEFKKKSIAVDEKVFETVMKK
jgi:hypothetical protein